jgi:hypothetical protein
MHPRPRWSDRRRRTLIGLAAGAVVLGAGAFLLPAEVGVTSGFLAALCAFLLVVAAVVFVVVPGPDTLGTLLRTVPLAGATLVVAVLLLLSAPEGLRPLWWAGVAGGAAWLGYALWATRDAEG